MCGAPLNPDDITAVRNRPAAAQRHLAASLPASAPIPASIPPAAPQSSPLDGERRVATIIFIDVKDSTELLEHLGTEAWVDLMNNVFQILELEIYRFCGEVGQFRGDGLVAYFGARSANEDDAEHAVLAGLAIQQAIKPVTEELARKEKVELALRVGINTGEIILTNIGDPGQYSEDTAMGEALTVASRMETAADPGTILVSDNCFRLVKNQFEWQSLGEITVKGISHPIAVYRPLAVKATAEIQTDGQLTPGITHRLIGRKDELDALKGIVEDLYIGRGGIAIVTGVKGMGKSFLVNQVRQHFTRQNVLLAVVQHKETGRIKNPGGDVFNLPVTWLRGRCRSYGHLRPYSMWLDLLQAWLENNPGFQESEAQASLRAQIEAQWGSEVERLYPNLASFLSTSVDETAMERVKHLDAEGMKRQFFETFYKLIEDFSRQGPLVVNFTDMQWADPTSLELLDYCLPLCDSESVLFLLVYRPDRDSPIWEFEHRLETNYPHRIHHFALPPFSDEESTAFIDQFIGNDVLFPETRSLLIRRSEGNPYFIKELIYALIAQGALVQESDRNWRQTRAVTSLDLPDSLQSLLMARLDRLTASERRVLQMAAVVGSVFWLNALQSLAGPSMTMSQLQADLVALQRAGLIQERAFVPDLGMEYTFDSQLIRDVAYESLLSNQRVSYHLRTAEYLEEIVFREGKKRYFNSLAHHYREAGDTKKELFYTLQAAERAHSIYANQEALRYYTRALDLLDGIEQQVSNSHQKYAVLAQKFEALNGRRAIHFLTGNIESGVEDARSLLDLARQMDKDPTWLIDALLQQPGVSGVTSINSREEVQRSVPLALEALELAQKIGDKRREMNLLLTIANQRNLLNDPSWVETGSRALELAREIGDRPYEALILLALSHAFVGRDEMQKGKEYLSAALPICHELDDKVINMTLLRVLGAQHEREGDHYRRLVEFEEKRLQITREVGNRFEEAHSLMFCGQIKALNLGDLSAGMAMLQDASQILSQVSGRLFPQLRIAQVQVALGQFEEAQDILLKTRELSETNVYDLGRAGWSMVALILYNALGDETHLRMALDLIEKIKEMGENLLISRQYRMAAFCEATAAHLSLARLLTIESERQDHLRLALESSRAAVDIYNSFGYVNIVECACEEIYFRHSQALAANGLQSESNEFLELADDEMMRKYEMIPAESHYRRTYLENISYHREIRAAVAAWRLLTPPQS